MANDTTETTDEIGIEYPTNGYDGTPTWAELYAQAFRDFDSVVGGHASRHEKGGADELTTFGDTTHDSVSADELSSTIAFTNGPDSGDATAGIQSAVDRAGSIAVVTPHTDDYVLSEEVTVPDDTTLHISKGATVTAEDNFVPNRVTTLNGRDIYTLLTNADHSNGNSNVSIAGEGRVTLDGTTQDDSVSWALAWLHKCDHSQVGSEDFAGLEIDNVFPDLSNVGTNRYFSALLTESSHSHIDGVHGHHTADDTLGIRRSCVKCSIRNCEAHHPRSGHCAQAAQGSWLGSAGTESTGIVIADNYLHDTVETDWAQAGAALHGAEGVIRDNEVESCGSAALVIDAGASGSSVRDITARDCELGGVRIWTYKDSDPLTDVSISGVDIQSNNGDPIQLQAENANIEDVSIHAERLDGGGYDRAGGVMFEGEGAYTIEGVKIDITASNCGNAAVMGDDWPEMHDIVIQGIQAQECGWGVFFDGSDSPVSDVRVIGGEINSTRNIRSTTQGSEGVTLADVTDSAVVGVRADVVDEAFVEQGSSADYNQFVACNGRGSGTSAVQTVGANTVTSANIS